jgi:hypothetical protein
MNQYVARTGLPRPWHTDPDWTGWVRLDEVRDALAALNREPAVPQEQENQA